MVGCCPFGIARETTAPCLMEAVKAHASPLKTNWASLVIGTLFTPWQGSPPLYDVVYAKHTVHLFDERRPSKLVSLRLGLLDFFIN